MISVTHSYLRKSQFWVKSLNQTATTAIFWTNKISNLKVTWFQTFWTLKTSKTNLKKISSLTNSGPLFNKYLPKIILMRNILSIIRLIHNRITQNSTIRNNQPSNKSQQPFGRQNGNIFRKNWLKSKKWFTDLTKKFRKSNVLWRNQLKKSKGLGLKLAYLFLIIKKGVEKGKSYTQKPDSARESTWVKGNRHSWPGTYEYLRVKRKNSESGHCF